MAGFVISRVHFTEEEGKEQDEEPESGLLVELEGKDEKIERETNLWFSKVHYVVFRLSLVTSSSLLSRLCESAVLSLQGIFSEINLEKDAQNELQQSDWLQNSQKGRGTLCVGFKII